jgi:hypothetical protein
LGGGNCRFHLSLRLSQSPFLEESLFQSASLEVTLYAKHGNWLFFYDSAGLWIDEAGGLGDRVKPEPLRSLLPEDDDCVVTAITAKNTDLGPLAVKSRSMSARSLARSGVFMGEHLHVVARAAGRFGSARRAIGFVRSRIREGEGAIWTAAEFVAWTGKVAAELDARVQGAAMFARFATPTDTPTNPEPVNILVDLDDFVGEFVNEENLPAEFDLESVCVNVQEDLTGPSGFPFRFDLVVDGNFAPVWIKWDTKKRKYWLRSDVLSALKLKDNERISLTRRLNQRQPFRIIVRGASVVYAYGGFYAADLKLDRPNGAGALVLNLVHSVSALSGITSEKGQLRAAAATWPPNSLFGLLDRALRPGATAPVFGSPFSALICDDLGDEVADFIGLDEGETGGAARAVLVVAKWKAADAGVSASALYDVCSQAVKNLAYLKADARELPGTPGKWNGDWKLKGGRVPRRRAGPGAVAFRSAFGRVRANPNAQRQVWMVLAGGILSRRALVREFAKTPPEPHVLQFYHLVLSAYSACQSVGVRFRSNGGLVIRLLSVQQIMDGISLFELFNRCVEVGRYLLVHHLHGTLQQSINPEIVLELEPVNHFAVLRVYNQCLQMCLPCERKGTRRNF